LRFMFTRALGRCVVSTVFTTSTPNLSEGADHVVDSCAEIKSGPSVA